MQRRGSLETKQFAISIHYRYQRMSFHNVKGRNEELINLMLPTLQIPPGKGILPINNFDIILAHILACIEPKHRNVPSPQLKKKKQRKYLPTIITLTMYVLQEATQPQGLRNPCHQAAATGPPKLLHMTIQMHAIKQWNMLYINSHSMYSGCNVWHVNKNIISKYTSL